MRDVCIHGVPWEDKCGKCWLNYMSERASRTDPPAPEPTEAEWAKVSELASRPMTMWEDEERTPEPTEAEPDANMENRELLIELVRADERRVVLGRVVEKLERLTTAAENYAKWDADSYPEQAASWKHFAERLPNAIAIVRAEMEGNDE